MSSKLTECDEKPAAYFGQDRAMMRQYVPANTTMVLEVGCGAGLFGAWIKQTRSAEVWGIELDSAAAERAKEHLDKVLVGDVQELVDTLPAATFDCIVFNDVLEHLADPYSLLIAVKRLLSPTGMVVCSIPNVRHFYVLFQLIVKKQWRYEDSGLMDKTHLRFFTKRSITEMFDQLGYDLLTLRGICRANNLVACVVNVLSLGHFSDSLYLQFACQARPKVGV